MKRRIALLILYSEPIICTSNYHIFPCISQEFRDIFLVPKFRNRLEYEKILKTDILKCKRKDGKH